MQVQFSDMSTGNIRNWYWDFGDGNTSTDSVPVHTYSKAGYYLVSLAVSDSSRNCSDYSTNFILVGEMKCVASFNYYVTPNTRDVKFTNTSTGTLASYLWDFNDGSTATSLNTEHIYAKDGLYDISLTVANSGLTCMDNIVTQVLIGSVSCDASFTYNVDSVTVYFKDTITGESNSLLWSFGDGNVSTQNNPVHKYLAQGYHTVGLNTYNSLSGCMDFSQKIILIGSEGIDCRFDFMYAVDPTMARKINFTDNSKGEIKGYIWNFGELNSSPAFTPNTSHTYNKGGYYNICLTVTDTSNISNTSCKSIAIATTAANNCKADFNFNIDSVSKTAIFSDVSLGNPNKREWDFGDNSYSTDTNPKHPYADAGFYLVSLKISTATGCSGKAYKLLNVNKISTGLVVAFGHDKDTVNTKAGGYPVDFVGAGLGDQSRLKWIFGDGSVDTTSTTPIHVYKKNGQYQVCYEISEPCYRRYC